MLSANNARQLCKEAGQKCLADIIEGIAAQASTGKRKYSAQIPNHLEYKEIIKELKSLGYTATEPKADDYYKIIHIDLSW